MEVRDVLLKAAKVVSEGWCQNMWTNPDKNEYCAAGALLHVVMEEDDNRAELWDASLAALADQLPDNPGLGPYSRIANWNDTPGRLAIEVEDALRETALSLEDA